MAKLERKLVLLGVAIQGHGRWKIEVPSSWGLEEVPCPATTVLAQQHRCLVLWARRRGGSRLPTCLMAGVVAAAAVAKGTLQKVTRTSGLSSIMLRREQFHLLAMSL